MDFEYFYGKQSSQYAFYRIPKQLLTERQFDALSIGAKLLYGMMVDRMELSQKNGWLDRNGRVYIYFTVDEVKDKFHCANDKAMKLIRELDSEQGIGLIQYDYNQSNSYQYCYIPVFGIAEVQKSDFKSSDFRNTRSQEIRLQEFWFSESSIGGLYSVRIKSELIFCKHKSNIAQTFICYPLIIK